MEIEEYFVRLFRTYFGEYRDKKIILYGMSERTIYIMRAFPEFQFLGVMGGESDRGLFRDKPILSIDEAASSGADILIIVARDQHIPMIAERLRYLWEKKQMPVYSVTGRNIHDYIGMMKEKILFHREKDTLLDQLKDSNYRGVAHMDLNQDEMRMVHLFAERVFSTSGDSMEKCKISSLHDFSYCFIAPMITTFIFFIIEEIKKGAYDKVLFAARDSFLIQKLYHMAIKHYKCPKMPEDIYFQTSRMACIVAATDNEADFFFQNTLPCAYDQRHMVHYRYQIDDAELDIDNKEKYPTTFDYLIAHKRLILSSSERLRNNYKKYIKKQGIECGSKCAFVDLVSSGTCQLMLDRFADITFKGIYLGRYEVDDEPERNGLPISSLYRKWNIGEKNDWESIYLFNHYWFIETIMTSCEPSLHYFDSEGNPVLCSESRSQRDLLAVKEMQEGIIEFFCDFITMSSNELPKINPLLPDMIYRYSSEDYTDVNCEYFHSQVLFEDLGLGILNAKGK